MFPPIALALVGCLALPGARLTPQTVADRPPHSTSVRQWREDLAYLTRELPRRHKNLFHTLRRDQFDSALAVIDRKLPTLTRHQVIVELARIVARVGDGHTNVAPTRDARIGFHTYPVKLYFFKDGSSCGARAGNRPPSPAPRCCGSDGSALTRVTRRCGS